jgi:hypothetical protein
MVKPLRSAFIAAVVLTEFHHHGHRVLSVWLRMSASDVAWCNPKPIQGFNSSGLVFNVAGSWRGRN